METRSRIPIVSDVRILDTRGPWTTKSGGELNVLFGLSMGLVQHQFLHYDSDEINRIPGDIRGLRVYTVTDLPNGNVGGTEWHRVREEMVFILTGSVRWLCEDLFGAMREFILDSRIGVWMPPFILHTYEVKEEGSGVLVVANTLFDPEDPRSHDTYSLQEFREMQTRATDTR